ncbi:hypothetical protein [Sphingomicrobium marinum]|uniref:hypothetical protein n=1 Tax=Sphingomicrobium marinum TaxID=1227950 RepID=UPI0022408D85|nr:hypothetical protein [Sphingomicrobium marinum]
MDPMMTIVLVVAVLTVGLGAGFFAATKAHEKGVQGYKDEADFQRARGSDKERELAAANERAARADELKKMLEAVTAERDAALRDKAAMEADERNFEKRMRDVENMRKDLAVLFQDVGDKMLDRAQEQFLARCRDFFAANGVRTAQAHPETTTTAMTAPETKPEVAATTPPEVHSDPEPVAAPAPAPAPNFDPSTVPALDEVGEPIDESAEAQAAAEDEGGDPDHQLPHHQHFASGGYGF